MKEAEPVGRSGGALITCPSCQDAIETNYLCLIFNTPQCSYCTARLIRAIGQLKTQTSAEITARRRVVLATALDYGHSETEMRALVKSGPWVQPLEREKPTKCRG